jgi:hypothetical protein
LTTARHVIPRLHTAGYGLLLKARKEGILPKSQSEGKEGLWPIIIHATATFACRSLGRGRSVSAKNRGEESIGPNSISAHTIQWRFPCGACARMHVSLG